MNGFIFQTGQRVPFLGYSAASGRFAKIAGPSIDGGRALGAFLLPAEAVLQPVWQTSLPVIRR